MGQLTALVGLVGYQSTPTVSVAGYHSITVPYPLPRGCCGLSTPLVGSVIHSTPVVGYRPNGAAAGHLLAYWSLGKEGERERAIKLNDNTQHSTTLDNHLSNHQNQLESIREHE